MWEVCVDVNVSSAHVIAHSVTSSTGGQSSVIVGKKKTRFTSAAKVPGVNTETAHC